MLLNHDLTETYIWVTFEQEGVHCYPAALTDPKLADVSFLGYPHRHLFGFRVEIQVFHDDRDLEFIQFKRWLQSQFSENVIDINHKSVEMLADDLAFQISEKYPNRRFAVQVSEDDENGCVKMYECK